MTPSRIHNQRLSPRRTLPLLAVALIATAAPGVAQSRFEFTKPEMGTLFKIHLYSTDKDSAQRAADAAFARIEAINQIASDYLPESELSRFNKAPDQVGIPVSTDLFTLIEKSQAVAQLTYGAFDITCAYAVQNWRRARRQQKLPPVELTKRAVEMTDWRALKLDATNHTVIKLKPALLIDLGGIGKGFAAHEALHVLKQHGITRALVAASGDIAIGDPPPDKPGWNVALRTFEKPEDTDQLIHLTLRNCGVSTSGDLHQFLELDGVHWSHIINPKTGLGLSQRIACTVIAPTAFESDAMATALCVLGAKPGLTQIEKLPNHHARFVILENDTPKTTQSSKFPTPP